MVLDLTAIEAPAIDPPEGVEIVTWAERPELRRAYDGRVRGVRRCSGRRGNADGLVSKNGSGRTCRATATVRRDFVALVDGEVPATPSSRSRSRTRSRRPRHHGRVPRLAWPRDRGAFKRAEISLGERRGYKKLETVNEVRNEPIRRLNARYGYALEPAWRRCSRRWPRRLALDVHVRMRLKPHPRTTAPSFEPGPQLGHDFSRIDVLGGAVLAELAGARRLVHLQLCSGYQPSSTSLLPAVNRCVMHSTVRSTAGRSETAAATSCSRLR